MCLYAHFAPLAQRIDPKCKLCTCATPFAAASGPFSATSRSRKRRSAFCSLGDPSMRASCGDRPRSPPRICGLNVQKMKRA